MSPSSITSDRRTRPLRDDERSLLDHLLEVDVAGVEELRAQAAHAEAFEDSWLPFELDLYVPEDRTPPATKVLKQVPIEAHTIRNGEHGLSVTLWMDGDFLDHIEVSWYDTKPTRLPLRNELRPARPF